MGVEGLPSIDAFVASLSADVAAGEEPAQGSAGAVAALTAALAADLAAQVARQSLDWPDRESAIGRAAEISARATALAGDVDRTFVRALAELERAASDAPGWSVDEDLGDVLIDIVALLLSIGEAAAAAAALARDAAASGSVSVRATAVAATMLAAGAAEAAAHLVDVNLLVIAGDPLANRAREHLDAARASRDAALALLR